MKTEKSMRFIKPGNFLWEGQAFLLLMLMFQGCVNNLQPGIKGEGEVVRRELEFPPIYGVRSSISGDIILAQGHDRPQEVTVFGQENILDLLEMEVNDGILDIGFREPVGSYDELRIELVVRTLAYVSLDGSGTIKSPATFYKLNELNVNMNGSGEIMLKPEALTIHTAINGSGNISLYGIADKLFAAINGSGDIKCFGLVANDCDATIAGSGDVELIATESLNARIVGSGDIRYRGNPTIKKVINGSGNLEEANE